MLNAIIMLVNINCVARRYLVKGGGVGVSEGERIWKWELFFF